MANPDPLTQQVRNILEAGAAMTAQEQQRIAKLEADGYRIIDGGQTGPYDADGKCGYAYTDCRTGETLASGHGTYEESLEALDAAAGNREICHRDRVAEVAIGGADDYGLIDPEPVPGIPDSLVTVLADWAESSDTTDEDLALVTGLHVDQVRELRRE